MSQYARTLDELSLKAVRYWPHAITEAEANLSILPRLLETQDQFISVLTLGGDSPEVWESLVDVSTDMPANLFLKHLMVLSDIGGEGLGKITPFDTLCFPNGVMRYIWREREYSYSFQTLVNGRKTGNSLLRVDAKGLLTGYRLTSAMKDVIMFLLYGDSAIGDNVPEDIKRKCVAGEYIGRPEELGRFIKRNYIRVSRQLAGAMSNSLGQITQDFVVQCLSEKLQGWEVTRNDSIPGISINQGATEASFDVVTKSPSGVYFGVEVSFQVTTNSVIERKARDAQGLRQRLHESGHFICYVVDGAGNIDVRKSAVRTICQFSDCPMCL